MSVCSRDRSNWHLGVGARQERIRLMKLQLNAAVRQIDASGQYPSLKRVAELLPKRGLIRDPELREEHQRLARELGWVNGVRSITKLAPSDQREPKQELSETKGSR